ncbi:hypothetical protein [Algicella marina]|uniref:Phosphomannomutase n=1 Tax=Algicella marina TaxID=2683284 RepID=A0A6P1T2U5_9RHOB|nr:hypothetical protein [Algicella marina]QHQ35786.1 hypothetical protein GO499_11680 [Algicella marina]
MFTNEHDFDASVITLIDEGKAPLREDVVVTLFDDQVTIMQVDDDTEEERVITLSLSQFNDLRTALNLPEGTYRRDGSAVD